MCNLCSCTCFMEQNHFSQVIIAFLLQDGWSSLMIASEKGHYDVITALIGAGAEISLTDKVV